MRLASRLNLSENASNMHSMIWLVVALVLTKGCAAEIIASVNNKVTNIKTFCGGKGVYMGTFTNSLSCGMVLFNNNIMLQEQVNTLSCIMR